MRKIITTLLACIISTAIVTGCTPLDEYSGTVEVTEMEHIKFRPKMGKMPMRTAKWQLTVCSTEPQIDNEDKCSVERISEKQFEHISIGQTIDMLNGKLQLD